MTFLSPSFESPLGRRNVVSVPRRLVPNGDTISLYTTSPLENFYRVPKYGTGTVPYRTVQVRYSKVHYGTVMFCSCCRRKKKKLIILKSKKDQRDLFSLLACLFDHPDGL